MCVTDLVSSAEMESGDHDLLSPQHSLDEFYDHDHLYPLHHLIYREELKKDGEKKPIRGSSRNCVECGNRPVYNNPSSKNHCLDFTEKLENEVVCSGCHEPVLGPAYKCCVSECSFFIHKFCTELSPEINHPLHPDHTLFLQHLPEKNSCDACCTSYDSSFVYKCYSCDFFLDIKCATRLPVIPDDCHQHEFSPIWKRIKFTCEVCGEEIKHIAHLCSICKLLVHKRCAEMPRTIKIKLHPHFLNLIYSSKESKQRYDMICRICFEKVNTEYAAYHCQKCWYVVHLDCINRFRDPESPTTRELVFNKFVGHTTHLMKALFQADDEEHHLEKIQHFSHQQHMLILYDDEIKGNKLCQGCMELIILAPFYGCVQCNFFLHTRCTKLSMRIEQHRLDDFHTLTLLPRAPTKDGVFFCHICSRHHRGFAYKCVNPECSLDTTLDVQCGAIPETFEHEGHKHLLFLALDSKRKCKACHKDNEEYVFVCTNCDFALGIRCANLPLLARHKYDAHLLQLTYSTVVRDSREYYCLICEEERDPNHWFYYCEDCDFSAHPECVLGNYPCIAIGLTYISEYHEHRLTFVRKTKESYCECCLERFDDVALECSQCKFRVHPPRPYFPNCLWKLGRWS